MKTSLAWILALSLGLMACDKVKKLEDNMDELKTSTGEVPKKMDKTNDNITKQKLVITLKEQISSESMDRLYPVPTGLMPFAKEFAETASAKDIVELSYLFLKEIDEVKPLKRFNEQGQEGPYSIEEQNKILTEKFGRFQALSAIAGFAPQATIDEMIQTQIYGSGRFKKTAYNVLMMRAVFSRQTLIQDSLLKSGKFESVGEAEEAVKYMNQVDAILRLPFRAKITLTTTGLTGPEGYNGPITNADLSMNKDMVEFLSSGWDGISEITETGLTIARESATGNSAQDEANFQRDLKRRDEVLRTARERAQTLKSIK